MRREELFNAVHKITKDLVDCKMQDLFKELLERYRHSEKGDNKRVIPLEIFKRFSILTHSYDETHIKVCKILGVAELLDSNFWDEISQTENPESIYNMHTNLIFANNNLPKILSLIEQDYVSAIKENKPDLPEDLKGKVLMNVLVIEEKGQFSSPQRLYLL